MRNAEAPAPPNPIGPFVIRTSSFSRHWSFVIPLIPIGEDVPMEFFLSHWPLWFISLAMIAAAVIDGWKLKVPNWLTFPLVLSGWALGIFHSFGLFTQSTGAGDFWASLAGTALGFVLLYPVHMVGGMGAGD